VTPGGLEIMSSWLSWAQDQGAAAMEAIQEDLGSFVTVVSEDTAAAAEEAHALAQAKIQENLAQISIESIQQSLDELDTYIEDTATANAEDKEYFTNCRMQKMEDVLIRNEQTFLSDPAAAQDAIDFVEWLEEFDMVRLEHMDEAEQLLKDKPDLFSHHIKFVPTEITNNDFWTRFFWGRHKIHVAEARRSAILEKAANEAQASEEEEGWDTWEEDPVDEVLPDQIATPATNCDSAEGEAEGEVEVAVEVEAKAEAAADEAEAKAEAAADEAEVVAEAAADEVEGVAEAAAGEAEAVDPVDTTPEPPADAVLGEPEPIASPLPEEQIPVNQTTADVPAAITPDAPLSPPPPPAPVVCKTPPPGFKAPPPPAPTVLLPERKSNISTPPPRAPPPPSAPADTLVDVALTPAKEDTMEPPLATEPTVQEEEEDTEDWADWE